jgi:hypothetical protein
MSEQIQIKKTIYSLQQFNNVVDTRFSQLINTKTKDATITSLDSSISKFFNDYDLLFYDIHLSGSDQSHLGLVNRSLDYLGLSLDDLQNEIEFLREENINLKNQIFLASEITTGSLQ